MSAKESVMEGSPQPSLVPLAAVSLLTTGNSTVTGLSLKSLAQTKSPSTIVGCGCWALDVFIEWRLPGVVGLVKGIRGHSEVCPFCNSSLTSLIGWLLPWHPLDCLTCSKQCVLGFSEVAWGSGEEERSGGIKAASGLGSCVDNWDSCKRVTSVSEKSCSLEVVLSLQCETGVPLCKGSVSAVISWPPSRLTALHSVGLPLALSGVGTDVSTVFTTSRRGQGGGREGTTSHWPSFFVRLGRLCPCLQLSSLYASFCFLFIPTIAKGLTLRRFIP